MDSAPRHATGAEVAAMARLLEQALDEGAAGLSTGLIYEPSKHASSSEVEALARVAARKGGIHATHLRSEGAGLLAAIDEAVTVSRNTGVALQIAHIKTSGQANWPLAEAAIARVEAARREGLQVHADRYPYLASGTELDVLLPDWAGQDGRDVVLARLRDAGTRRRIVADMERARPAEYWSTVMVGGTWCEATHPCRGQRLDAAARRLGLSPAEAVVWIVEHDELRTGGFFFGMCEVNLRLFLSQPWVMIGSDASIRAPTGPLSQDHPHPRAYGAHARALAMAREGGPLSLAETVRRMTALPAAGFGLAGRGTLAVGQFADLAVFDAARVVDRATYGEPHQLAEGMRHVFVNGAAVLLDGHATGRLPGRCLGPRQR
jgi:N-acyl-D-amino-acid deacylase